MPDMPQTGDRPVAVATAESLETAALLEAATQRGGMMEAATQRMLEVGGDSKAMQDFLLAQGFSEALGMLTGEGTQPSTQK